MLDECADNRLAEFLRKLGHDVVLSPKRSRRFSDRKLFAASANEERILITTDLNIQPGYWEWLEEGNEHPGLLLGVQRHGQHIGRLMQDAQRTIEALDEEALQNNLLWLGS